MGAGEAVVERLLERELERFEREHPRSLALSERSGGLLSGVPMNWMTRWAGRQPIWMTQASGAQLVDVDGNRYTDFCLGDTAAMAGHAPEQTVAAIAAQASRGIATMLPSEDASRVGELLAERFGLARWQLTTSATDANRFVVRLARQITGRPRILVFDHCYHGSVDETVVTLSEGRVVPRVGNVGPPVDPALTTRVVQFNDAEALERELAHEDVACVLAEPALTNIGIVPPAPGFHERLRELTRRHGTLLVIDETHTLCAGPGGMTVADGLEPDLLTVGKAIGGGIAVGAYGMTEEVAARVLAETVWDAADVGGVGGTLAGNALSLAAVRATLEHVLTPAAFAHMDAIGRRFADGVQAVIGRHGLPWHVTRIGARAEYLFLAHQPLSGAQAAAAFDHDLDALMHVAMLNRGILLTPFHMMALACPATTEQDVERHTDAFAEIVGELVDSGAVAGRHLA
jgi:glutamate-1-semialdehyde aminotransferase